MATKMTPDQAVDILRRKYLTNQITITQLLNGVMEIARCNEKFFYKCAAMHQNGDLIKHVTGSDDLLGDLEDAYDDWKVLAKASTAKLIRDVESGRITSAQAQAEMKKLQAQGDEAWDSLSWYQKPLHAADPFTDFFSARWSEVKNATKKVGSFTGQQYDKFTTAASTVITDASGAVKSVGEGAGSLLKAGGFIIPVIIGIAGFTLYKVLNSDAGKVATRRFT